MWNTDTPYPPPPFFVLRLRLPRAVPVLRLVVPLRSVFTANLGKLCSRPVFRHLRCAVPRGLTAPVLVGDDARHGSLPAARA